MWHLTSGAYLAYNIDLTAWQRLPVSTEPEFKTTKENCTTASSESKAVTNLKNVPPTNSFSYGQGGETEICFILLYVDTQFSQHPLLMSLSFLQSILLTPLSKPVWLQLRQPVSLFYSTGLCACFWASTMLVLPLCSAKFEIRYCDSLQNCIFSIECFSYRRFFMLPYYKLQDFIFR